MGGQCGVVLAAPGVGKTTFCVQWAAQSRVPCLYVSSDTGPKDLSANLASLATGHRVLDIKDRLGESDKWTQTYADAIYRAFPNLIVDFSSAPTLEKIAEMAEALCDVWGEPPRMIVIDTASDIAKVGEGFEAWQNTWLASRDMSRYFNTFIALAHHVKGGAAASGNVPPQQDDGMYKADQFAEIVLGGHRSGPNQVTWTVLKNRGGRNQVPFPLEADLGRARLLDPVAA